MKKEIAVRTGGDRLRYSILFEVMLIATLAPLGALIFERNVLDIGLLTIVLCSKAMLINLIYNWFYDIWDVRSGRVPTERSLAGRISHAVGFECCLVLTSLPIVVWWLGLTILQALLMDFAVTGIVVVYTIVFGWCYDRIFPIHQPLSACSE